MIPTAHEGAATLLGQQANYLFDRLLSDLRAQQIPRRKAKSETSSSPVDKSVLVHPEARRIRDREHVRFVAQQSCLVCGRQPCDAHHLRFAQNRALSRKVSDAFTVPLCRGHHRELHRHGDETAWWGKLGVDPTSAARALWLETHPPRENTSCVVNAEPQANRPTRSNW
jgi:hypothetical protein